ncbi:hypothetical protein [Entomohabitans teleogrylli]|uniref:hypothetical protein n=1 Tax=Entomohabitans teleogrylli TaxID=1384589 RepID=UPI00073D2E72|nr:hypothetical protein [Entomohabitans teleogrylli]
MSTVVLNVKVSVELKEKLRHCADEAQETLSSITEKLLWLGLQHAEDEHDVSGEDIDNQHTEEDHVPPLSAKEIKLLRKIMKKRK